MSSIERLETGPRMSQAVIHNGVVYLAGQVADDAKGASVTAQTENILKKIDALLKAAGTDKSKMLSARVWLTDMRKFDEMNKVWDAWVVPGHTPTRVCVEAKLAAPEYTTYALSRADWKSLMQGLKLIAMPTRDPDADEVELWSYPPALFAERDRVDRLSLYLSLQDERDERVEASLDEMMKNVAW